MRRRDFLTTAPLAAVGVIGTSISGCLRNKDGELGNKDGMSTKPNMGVDTVRYANDEGVKASSQSLDIYYSRKSTDLDTLGPVIVYVHGGGWMIGDKKRVHSKPQWVDELGGVFVSVNYRLTSLLTSETRVRHPDHIQDVARATAWVFENIEDYGGNPERVFVMGHSAGAHLVSLVATAGEYLRDTGHETDQLAGVFPIDCGLFDLIWAKNQGGFRSYLIDTAIGKDKEVQRKASPQHRLGPEDKELPKFMISYTNQVRRKATHRFVSTLEEVGVESKLVDRTDLQENSLRAHIEVNRRIGTEDDILTRKLEEFIESE